MSGEGIVSVRLPRSLLGLFRAAGDRQGLTIHEAARRLVVALPSLSQDDLSGLAEPPQELDNPRISLYLGWRRIDVLCAATRNGTITNSTIFRRLLYGLLVTKQIEFVQHGTQVKLQFANPEADEKPFSNRPAK